MKFALLTLGSDEAAARFVFFATRVGHLADERRAFTLSAEDIRLINPNTRTCPVFRSAADAELTKRIYARIPVLLDEAEGASGNPWGITFRQGLFNLTTDSGSFRMAPELTEAGGEQNGPDWVMPDGSRLLPLYEAKTIHHFDHRWATYEADGHNSRDATTAEKVDQSFMVRPRWWVPEAEVTSRLAERGWSRKWLMGWRDICRATDERTVIAAAFPKAGIGNSLPLFFTDERVPVPVQACLVACLSSLACDFFARHKVGGTH